jgi:drug/metabolite transporter (DMT)-like permease
MKFLNNFSNINQGIIYAIIATFFASLMVAIVRHLSFTYHIFFIVMVRNFFALAFFAPQIIKDYKGVFKTKKLSLHIFRGTNGLLGMFFWFYAVAHLELSEAVSISFLAPILTTIMAIFFLKEKVNKNCWIALLTGLIGILIILRPGFREIKFAYISCFLSVITWSITNVLIKMMIKTEKPQTIVAYMSLVMLVLSIPFALPYLKAIPLHDLTYFILIGVFSNLTHVAISMSFSKADVSMLQPFDFVRLIFTAIIAYFAFGEVIDFWVIIGSMVILLGVIAIAPHEKWRKKQGLLID